MNRPLPQQLSSKWGHLPDLKYRGSNEWSSACPQCGGAGNRPDDSDRFRLFDASNGHGPRGWCRRCGFFAWADQDKEPVDPVRIKEAEELRVEMARQEERRLKAKIEELQRQAYYQGWHDAMSDQHRQLWRDQGIADSLQDWFKLGFVEERTFYNGSTPFCSSAMTIPHFDNGWEAVNIQYRIIDPPLGVGKYRYTAGLPAPLFLTEPDEPIEGSTILVEGAKKGIVIWAHLGSKYKVIAVPSKMPGKHLIDRLRDCDPVYLVLDPDAYTPIGGRGIPAINRLAKMIGGRARIVKLPVKPDDMLVKYKASPEDILYFMSQAAAV